jgi:hypothetical protein
MPATHPHPQLEMCTGGIHDSGSRPISNSSRSGERQPSRCSRASSCPSTRWSLPALPSAPPRRSAPPRSAPEADACPSPTSPHHPLDSHNASQPARGKPQHAQRIAYREPRSVPPIRMAGRAAAIRARLPCRSTRRAGHLHPPDHAPTGGHAIFRGAKGKSDPRAGVPGQRADLLAA